MDRVSRVVRLDGCRIHTLRIEASCRRIELINCHVGALEFAAESVNVFSIVGGSILSISFPASNIENPLRSELYLSPNTHLPRSRVDAARPTSQGFRNLRHHVTGSGDIDLIMRLHATEERIDRSGLDIVGRQISRLYDWFSGYGASIARPLILLVVIWGATVGALAYFDLTEPPAMAYCVGWRAEMCEATPRAAIVRALVVGTQPLGLASSVLGESPVSRPIAKYPWVQLGLVLEGILSLTILTFALIAIRRRFRLQM